MPKAKIQTQGQAVASFDLFFYLSNAIYLHSDIDNLSLKFMSKLLITKYHHQLHEIINVGETCYETSITFAFKSQLALFYVKSY
jgi:sterol desaturase/sphingolipid hydroxylase (fatty acid hydroxylase superfamily)